MKSLHLDERARGGLPRTTATRCSPTTLTKVSSDLFIWLPLVPLLNHLRVVF